MDLAAANTQAAVAGVSPAAVIQVKSVKFHKSEVNRFSKNTVVPKWMRSVGRRPFQRLLPVVGVTLFLGALAIEFFTGLQGVHEVEA